MNVRGERALGAAEGASNLRISQVKGLVRDATLESVTCHSTA